MADLTMSMHVARQRCFNAQGTLTWPKGLKNKNKKEQVGLSENNNNKKRLKIKKNARSTTFDLGDGALPCQSM